MLVVDGAELNKPEKKTYTLAEENKMADEHVCNCEYNDWAGNWGQCSKTCIPENGEDGIQKEQREVKWNPRNNGTECEASELEREKSCNPGCCSKSLFLSI